jgi:iron complex transport system substrate-binding protein
LTCKGEWRKLAGASGGLLVCAALALVLSATTAAGAARAERVWHEQEAAKTETPVATKIVTDESGRRVAVPVNVRRVVSLAPNLTETMYALGLGDKVAGDTIYCDTPEAAKEKPHVGAPVNPNLEAIVSLHPDLVLATSINRWETVDALAKLGIAVYTTDPHTVTAMLETTTLLGDLLGAHEQAGALVTKLQGELDAIQAPLKEKAPVHVLFTVWEDPPISIGQNTFIADALRWAGAESVILAKQDWPQVSMEEIVRLRPEYIVLISNHDEGKSETVAKQLGDLRARAAWNELEAVKLGRVVLADEEFVRPSPGLVGAIVNLAHSLHPELFSGAGAKSAALNLARPAGCGDVLAQTGAAEMAVTCAR